MTTPPPSETGPSAEELAQEVLTVADEAARAAVLPMEGVEMEFRAAVEMASGNVALRIAPILNEWRARLVSEAKRSTHLEDARAGCDWCARRPNAPEKRDGWKGWWHRGKTKGSQRAFFKCERPEVWDALSLLPGGQK